MSANSDEEDRDSEERENVKASHGRGKDCPQCGEPLDDVRKTCANCGYELKEEDYADPEAGTEFRAGSAVDEEGREVEDWDPDSDTDSSDEDELQT
jgi:uncharacterized OB-fold protein